jgi:hypothetical protein
MRFQPSRGEALVRGVRGTCELHPRPSDVLARFARLALSCHAKCRSRPSAKWIDQRGVRFHCAQSGSARTLQQGNGPTPLSSGQCRAVSERDILDEWGGAGAYLRGDLGAWAPTVGTLGPAMVGGAGRCAPGWMIPEKLPGREARAEAQIARAEDSL